MTKNGIYIYAVVPTFYSTEMFRSLEKTGVYAIGFQNISAIVSDSKDAHINYADKESLGRLLVKHQKTIEGLQLNGFSMLLPMQLGTIVRSKNEVIEILKNGHTLIIDTLKNIDSLMEIDVAISWTDFPSVLREISQHADIIALKEGLAKKAEPISQMDQIKMGMMVQAKLKERNTQLSKSILESIVPICSNIKLHEVMNDEMILNAAFLLNKNNQVDFETKIDQVDKQFEGKLNFKLVGPLPCYSFYTLYVENLESRAVIQAKNKLGLPEETTEAQIKKAYLDKAKLSHPDATFESDNVEDFDSIKNAYQTLLTYASAVRQTSSDKLFSLITEEINRNLILVKIKE